jgi:hypothetical protein
MRTRRCVKREVSIFDRCLLLNNDGWVGCANALSVVYEWATCPSLYYGCVDKWAPRMIDENRLAWANLMK